MEESVLEQDATFAGAEARSQSGASPIVSLDKTGGTPITQIQSGTSGFSAPSVGGVATLTSPLTAKGDIYTHDGTKGVKKAVGVLGTIPVADPAETVGWKWAAPGTGVNADFASQFLLAGA